MLSYRSLLVLTLASSITLTPSASIAQVQPVTTGDQVAPSPRASAIKLEDGYKIEPYISNLSVPTTAIFDGNDIIIAESGYLSTAKPRILRVSPNGQTRVLASEGLEGPVTGLLKHNEQIYVSHKGKVSIIEANGRLKDIVTDLPSNGDHHNNNIVLGPDSKIYLGQGTSTNSGVVGEDNHVYGWLAERPQVHEIPCKDITLTGENFETGNPLTEDKNDKATTGAYKPFGTPSKAGEVIKGSPKCGGSIVRFNPDGSGFELVAWGLRNPFGLEFDKNGQLWSTFHGTDVRGSRNIQNDPDYLVQVKQDAWYGWPEYFDGQPATEDRFQATGKVKPTFLWEDHPPLTKPFMTFESHAGTNGLVFSPGGSFGHEGDAFIAEFGTFAPVTTGTNLKPAGFRIARVDLDIKQTHDFAANELPGPAHLNRSNGFDRPSDVVFGADNSLYVVDWGASTLGPEGLKYDAGSGKVWRIYKDDTQQAIRPEGPIVVASEEFPNESRKPNIKNVPELYKMLGPTGILYGLSLVLIIGIIIALVRRRQN